MMYYASNYPSDNWLTNAVFMHQNFPDQFRHFGRALAAQAGNRVLAICHQSAPKMSFSLE
jgi:hypothetical protein